VIGAPVRGLAVATLVVGSMLAAAARGIAEQPPGQLPEQPPVARETTTVPLSIDANGRAAVPWRVGERLEYDVRFKGIRVGQGLMAIDSTADVRGRETYHLTFRVKGRALWFSVNDVIESWIDTRTLNSLRFAKDQQEGRREKEIRYEIYPERATYDQLDDEEGEVRSVSNPLDDGSFLYFARTLPLRDGDVYVLHRYFRPDRNPVRIRVLRRETIRVPAGTFRAVVVQPSIKAKGIFSEGGKAEVWLSDDADRLILQMKSSLPVGSLNLHLKSRTPGS
jgi:hypothetical protein